MTLGLPVSRLVDVSVSLTPSLPTFPNLSTLLLLGTSNVIDVETRIRSYADLDAVGADFGGSSEEYLSATVWFEQNPAPDSLLIGRWANAATKGYLYCGPLAVAQQAMSYWTAISNGSFQVSINGVAKSITGLDFSAQTTLNGVASVIQTALAVATAGTTCVYDSVRGRFFMGTLATGASATMSFLTAGVSGTSIASTLQGLSSSSGAYTAAGIAAETALACVTLFDQQFSDQWYAVVIPSAVDADAQVIAAYIETASTPHLYGVTSQEAGCISAASTTDLAYLLAAGDGGDGYDRTVLQYSSENAYAVVSLLSRILTTNWQGNNTTITLMYKQEPGITAETLTVPQIDALEAKKGNVFVTYNNDTAIIEPGCCTSGQFVDSIIGCDWLASQVRANVYALLYGANKIPQTDAGMHLIGNSIEAACVQGVANGLLAPGVWSAAGFGQIVQGSYLSKGYYIYIPPIATQSQADRAARLSVPFQVAAKLAGAVHEVDVSISVNP